MYNYVGNRIYQTALSFGSTVDNKEITSKEAGFNIEELFDTTSVDNVSLIGKIGAFKVRADMTNVNKVTNAMYFCCHKITGNGATLKCVNVLVEIRKVNSKFYLSVITETE